jgi:hypothetical protein
VKVWHDKWHWPLYVFLPFNKTARLWNCKVTSKEKEHIVMGLRLQRSGKFWDFSKKFYDQKD